MMNIKEFKEFFDEQFLVIVEEKAKVYCSYSDNKAIPEIMSHVQAIAREGKRIRPYLTYCGYVTEGGAEEVMPLYAAIEFVHLFCLLHDDIIDNADSRHGVATISKKFGRAIAILVGDLLLSWAYQCLDELEAIEPYTVDDAREAFAMLLSEVIHGQTLDVLHASDKTVSRDMIETAMRLKSARYSFYFPLSIGMLLAGGDEDARDFAKDYAVNLGMAFQLFDDIADCPIDMQEKKQTLLSWYSDTNPDSDFADAISFAEEVADEYVAAASDALFSHDKNNEPIWEELIDEVQHAFL